MGLDEDNKKFYDFALFRRDRYLKRLRGGNRMIDSNHPRLAELKARHDELAAWAEQDMAKLPIHKRFEVEHAARDIMSQIAAQDLTRVAKSFDSEPQPQRRRLSRDEVFERLARIGDIVALLGGER